MPTFTCFESMSITASSRSGELVFMPRRRSASLSPSCPVPRSRPWRWHRARALGRAPEHREAWARRVSNIGGQPAARSRAVSRPTSSAYWRGGAETEHEGVGEFPGLEAPGIGGELEGVALGPGGAVHIDQEWMGAPAEHPIRYIEEPRPRGPRTNLRAVAARKSQPRRATSIGI